MNVVCCQLDIVWENKAANHAKVDAMLTAACPPRDSLVLLPEMFATGFSMNVAAISDMPQQETQHYLMDAAARHGVYLLAGLVTTSPDGRGRNEAVLVSPRGQEIGRYQKIHPFTFGGESGHFEPGSGVVALACQEFAISPFVCYDLRFPEAFRCAVRRGANLLAVIANWPAARTHHWVTLLQARAIENQSYVVAVNRCGRDPKLCYPGRSMIIDPRGAVLADAGDSECTISAQIDLASLAAYRQEFPALADIRWNW